MQKKKEDSKSLFQEFYFQIYGSRWIDLRNSLLMDTSPVSLSEALSKPYFMDKASIIAASCLPVAEGDQVLDMCAAPGGKTLVLALKLNGTGKLVSNDRSATRRGRLRTVISECLAPAMNSNISITGHDSSKWGLYEQEMYDAVLLDPPCSSERHVITDPHAMDEWSPSRPKHLSIQQYAMLNAAFTALRKGGFILYSTCSICPMENQKVVEKLFQRNKDLVEEIPTDSAPMFQGEKLDHGTIILPDVSGGLGPLYFCLLRKKQ